MLSEMIRKLRENSGLTQQQVADVLNIDRSTYAYYEIGKTSPSINTMRKLTKMFNVSYETLIDGDERSSKFSDAKYHYSTGNSQSEQIYSLSKQEMEILLYFRLMDDAERTDLQSELAGKNKEKEKDKDQRK